ncbi:ABC transporter substrate-binding protein [Paenibacillus sp. UMB4589-SE434]|uniref:ABC transporter substrate-binding protein n=1 Tax=Paenibacillus sp. UMB4589-SE434 TaxID=3046314 RepID=UPI00254B3A7E|nr:ABC transporter substrate-binding protein [Paenibacillus sp. UMB4589-SE434]MDK8183338.1 ABC transporter substrate-binding protein [Paenibacillus sp. UMB4589-SE434]
MFRNKRTLVFLCMMFIIAMLSACGAAAPPAQTSASNQPANNTDTDKAATRMFKDIQGREVEIPVVPQKVVYVGSNPGDLLAIGVKPIGATLSVIASQIAYPEMIKGITDVGYPYSQEKVLALEPDLIIFDDWDVKGLASLEKIAPTIVTGLDDATPTKDRVMLTADVLGRTEAAETWFKTYEEKADATRNKLQLKGNETAVSLLLMGKNMFIMGNQGLNTTLYGQLGFKPSAGTQQLVDKNGRFVDISSEVLPDYMGSDIFILNDSGTETMAAQNNLMDSSMWKTIPAVKQGHVYTLDSKFNYDDPITLDLLLDEIVQVMSGAGKK